MKYNIILILAVLVFVCTGCEFQSANNNYSRKGNAVVTTKKVDKRTSINKNSKAITSNKRVIVQKTDKKTYLKKELKKVAPNSSFKILEIKPNIRNYLNQSKITKQNFEGERKFIVSTEIMDSPIGCPYGEVFRQSFFRVRNNSANRYEFDFYPRMVTLPASKELAVKEADNTVEFFNTCPIICIVIPKSNCIITYNEVGDTEGIELQYILDYLKNNNW